VGKRLVGKRLARRRLAARANRRRLAVAAAWTVAGTGLTAAAISGCSSSAATSAPAPGAVGSTCGTTRTGANVAVIIKVTKGTVRCGTAMSVENGYATLLKHGQVRGNGGGAPVTLKGWTCQGYPTPEVLRTGNASECHTTGAEVVAVIQLPASAS
jgi:hypothetical protein